MSTSHTDTFLKKMIIFISKPFKCSACKGSKIIKGNLGGIEALCNKCGKFTDFNRHYIHPVWRFFSKHLVSCTVLACVIMTFLAFYTHNLAFAVSLLGTIFAALKFKLDRANYHKDLFQQRYEIYLMIDGVLTDWCMKTRSTRQMYEKISGDLMRRSYFLFSSNTYEFIAKFRQALIHTEKDADEIDDPKDREEVQGLKEFLLSLIEGQKLSDQFPELKIDLY